MAGWLAGSRWKNRNHFGLSLSEWQPAALNGREKGEVATRLQRNYGCGDMGNAFQWAIQVKLKADVIFQRFLNECL